MNWRTYIVTVLAAAVLMLAATALANYTIDVRGIYTQSNALRNYIARYVAELSKSNRGLVSLPYERAVKLELARVTSADCAVTGSSREMRTSLRTMPALSQFNCKALVNLGVSGGTYEDLLIALSVLVERKSFKTVFVGIGPWALRSNADSRWTSDFDLLATARRNLGLDRASYSDGSTGRLANLINGSYLWRNLNYLVERRGQVGFPSFAELGADRPLQAGEFIMLPDGSLYDREKRQGTVGDGSYKIAEPFIESRVAREFEQVIVRLAQDGIRVVPILSPYHPKVWDCQAPNVCPALTAVEAEVRSLARKHGLPVVGSYDPRRFGLTGPSFQDDIHLFAEGLERVTVTQ